MFTAASTKEPEEREFVVIQERVCIWSERKTLTLLSLETVWTSRSPTTVMTANGEVQTREGPAVYVKELDLVVKVMLLEEIPAILSLVETLWWIMGIHTTGSAVKNHISSEMAREFIAINRTMYHLWF